MDYSKPLDEGNNITLGLAMYRPATATKGVLFFNPGGSDAGAVVPWQAALNLTDSFVGLEEFDLMAMDVRGTYSSNQLNVSLSTFDGILGPYPTTNEEFENFKAASATVIQSWIDSSTPPGIIQHVGTVEVIQDYEMIRKALGYEKISFLGDSYGSFRATQYAVAYPQRVNRFVLDAVVPHGRNLSDQAKDNIAALNRGILRADAYCQNNASCPFHSEGQGSVPRAFKAILESATQAPLNASCAPACITPVTPFDIRQGMSNALMDSPDFPTLLDELYEVLHGGDASFFATFHVPNVEDVVSLALECGDYDYVRDFETFNQSLSEGLQNDTNDIGVTTAWQIQLWCSGWPFPIPASTSSALTTTANMLLVTSDFDASAPTEWATFTWSQLPNSTLVVRHGDDHVSFPLVHQPSTILTKEFLNTGVSPNAGEDQTLVSVYTPGMVRASISDPYDVPTGAQAGDVNSDGFAQFNGDGAV
ncbi:alpha/beta-hydrolase [Gymnopus androsaceus JB14]|uniref:Alpha/beta-hydrolase n=1 Tax=Gymnopus androsaceus JB14 TaxID=1447944 RepID=A0A6A4HIB1_9AGAR|nr:alpha/beta-hydrolase [Gymnopus androsaceus JB14]